MNGNVMLAIAILVAYLLSGCTHTHYEDGSGTVSVGTSVRIVYCLPDALCQEG